jgi:very-short-patch-repair endonuclease
VPNKNARELRKRLTPQEVKLWVKLRELKSTGSHFRRQAPIGRYIVDFVSFKWRIVIEVDGGQHGLHSGRQADKERDAFLRTEGFKVLRFWNTDIDRNLNGVIETIMGLLNSPTPALRADLKSELRSPRTPQGGGINQFCALTPSITMVAAELAPAMLESSSLRVTEPLIQKLRVSL